MTDALPPNVTGRVVEANGSRHSYQFMQEIGSGGMATVYLARQLDTGSLVAIKSPRTASVDESRELTERFAREMEIGYLIKHENVIRVLDHGLDGSGMPFMVMEYVPDVETLHDWVQRRQDEFYMNNSGAKIHRSLAPLPEILIIFRQIMAGLGAIHAAGILIRDLKPENILVSEKDGTLRIKIIDFGVAKNLRPRPGEENLTKNMVVGTPYYLSPEHIVGFRKHPVTGKEWMVGPYSDIWSALVILYRMVSGQLPFNSESSDLNMMMGYILNEDPVPITNFVEDVNPGILQLFEVGFRKLPWERPQTVEKVLEHLETIEACERISNPNVLRATLKSISHETKDPPKWAPIALGATALCLLAGVVGLMYFSRQDRTQTLPPSAAPSTPMVASVSSVQVVTHAPDPVPSVQVAPSATPFKRVPGECPTQASEAYVHGIKALARNDYSVASDQLKLTLVRFPSCPSTLRLLGDSARKRGKDAEARKYYESYLAFGGVEPLSAEVQSYLAGAKK